MTHRFSLNRFRTALAKDIAAYNTIRRPEPARITPWQAMSLLQKAIRRGERDLALIAASTLLQISPDRFWRRAGVIAFEDIGIADLHTVAVVTVAMGGKRVRKAFGGDWVVASRITEMMVAAPKNRAADDLLAVLDSWSDLDKERQWVASLSEQRIRCVALGTDCLFLRALILQRLLGQSGSNGRSAAFDLLAEIGVAPNALEIARIGYSRTGELLAPLVALLTLQNGLKEFSDTDLLTPETRVHGLPVWMLDMFTREGKAALRHLLKSDAPIASWVNESLPEKGRAEFLGQALFRVESGLLRNRRDGETGEYLRSLMNRECLGVPPDIADTALTHMRDSIPHLNAIRADLMGGSKHD